MRGAWRLALASLLACSSQRGLFPLSPPLWRDDDQHQFAPEPEEYVSPMVWDVGDQSVFYPLTRITYVDLAGESVNVNSLDEVPDSSWFENRIGRFGMSPGDVARGPCPRGEPDPPTPWKVTGAKPNGANPGFMIKDATGQRHLVKFDGTVQGPRATAADVIVSKLFHAAGYHVPCNRIVSFRPSEVTIGEGASSENDRGEEEPLTQEHLEQVYLKALRFEDGQFRASTSKFLPGKPIGPFTYQGLRSDDPNDAIPHQDRRELRGMRLLSAWTQHFDAREQNTLDMWIASAKGAESGFIRHNVIDFGDCFGSVWEPPSLGRRLGHSHYFDIPLTLSSWFTLGIIDRPWEGAHFGRSGKVFGYFDVERFEPEAWRAGYPNPAYSLMSERDGAWMARIVSRFSDAHLEMALSAGELQDEMLRSELSRILRGRRDRILERYLTRLSPLSEPGVRSSARRLCLRDLLSAAGVRRGATRRYAVTEHAAGERKLGPVQLSAGDHICVDVPPVAGASRAAPAYRIVDVVSQSEGYPAEFPARVHLYDLGEVGLRVAGLERPESFDPPPSR